MRGAAQVRARYPDAACILVLAPSRAAQEERLRARGDPPDKVAARIALGEAEERMGRDLADHVVVNDDLGRASEELAAIVKGYRLGPPGPVPGEP